MLWYAAFVGLRLFVTVFVLLTSAYSVLNYTPFVFNQFLKPRMFGSINEFVASHHLWYCAAYAASVITLIPDLKRSGTGDRLGSLTRRLALGYVVVFGLVGEWLVVTPYLPTLWNDSRSFVAALAAFFPLLWLASIDHLASRPGTAGRDLVGVPADVDEGQPHEALVTGQRRLLVACVSTAAYLWLAHFVRAIVRQGAEASAPAWVVDASWGLSVSLVASLVLYAVLDSFVALAAATRAPRVWEYALVVALAAGAISWVLLKVVFAGLAFGDFEPVAVALTAGLALALAWSGAALRRPRRRRSPFESGLDLLVAPIAPAAGVWPVAALVVMPLATAAALAGVERVDWNFLLQEVTVVTEWALTFAFIFALTRRLTARPWSRGGTAVPPLAAALAVTALAHASVWVPAWTGDARREAEVELDRYAGADPSFKLLYDGLVRHPGRDPEFRRYLQRNTAVSTAVSLTAPDAPFARSGSPGSDRPPHVFLFVLDSLRRDYLSPFNPRVTFTPAIGQFADESFAFHNAFSRYGGTSLAVPSIWAGGLVIHRTWLPDFARSNGLEKLVDANRYRWFMSVDSVMAPLISPHSDLVELDRGRRVMDFDFCRTLVDLEEQLDRPRDERPAFAFSLPQNLHISLRQHGPVPDGEHYPGFFEPYAAEVHRMDTCFGRFVAFLKRKQIFDDSVIMLTTDHGDSLGEEGRWGHGVTLFPEVVRIPLIVHLPDRLKARLTTDLARLVFSTDIVPTLYGLLGYPVKDFGPLFGSPMFVPRQAEPSPRRRNSFLLASSYGPTYGLLRRNGRSLYIVDLVNGREFAFDLTAEPLGTRVPVTDDIRRVNQPLIRDQVAALADLYHFHPPP